MTELTKYDKKLLADIDKYGWHVLKIMEDEVGPGFTYSIGLYKSFNHPEIVIVGLNPDLSHLLINNIAEDINNGKVFLSGLYYPDILDDFDCLMLQVLEKHYNGYFGYANWFYNGKNFPVLQCIYPTTSGVYPFDDQWPKNIKHIQPILGKLK